MTMTVMADLIGHLHMSRQRIENPKDFLIFVDW